MDAETFLRATLDDLAACTYLEKSRWSKYLRGDSMSEKTISRIAAELHMTPDYFIYVLNQKREHRREILAATNGRRLRPSVNKI
jgi:transcriptional regulator with XRE-family HTH domain